jgi:hypothetical protein
MPDRTRVSIDVDKATFDYFTNSVPWGDRGRILRLILNDFVDLMKEHGPDVVIGAYVSKAVRLNELSKMNFGKET